MKTTEHTKTKQLPRDRDRQKRERCQANTKVEGASPPETMERKTRPQGAQATVQSLLHVGSPRELFRTTLKRKKLSDNELMYKLFVCL